MFRAATNPDDFYLQMAELARTLSNDPDTQVGAVIVTCDGPITVGANVLPDGVRSEPSRAHRPLKYQYLIRAGVSAIAKAHNLDLRGATMYLSCRPCVQCSQAAIQAGIKRLVYRDIDCSKTTAVEVPVAIEMFREAGVALDPR